MTTTGLPAVTVVINCYNGEKYLRQAIDSVYAQTAGDWEIVFWDDASTDASASIARSYDARLRYFRGETRIPLYAARNRAIAQARGSYIGFLDCDDEWLPDKLEKQIAAFAADARVGLVYSNVRIVDADGRGRVWYQDDRQPQGSAFGALLQHYHLMIPSVMVARRALDSLRDGFDESLHMSGDTDLFLRIAHDWNVAYVPQVTALYREHGENMTVLRRELGLVENDYIVSKLSRLYDGFRRDYQAELIAFSARAHKGFVFNTWRSGRSREARGLARRYLSTARAMFALYLLSFVPVKLATNTMVYAWLRRLTRRAL